MVVQGGLTNSWEKKQCERQGRKWKIYPFECRVPKNGKNKKASLSDQCKEIEENNRMGKTSVLFKKIRDTKGTFHAKKGSIKDRNGIDLTEADNIKKRWQQSVQFSPSVVSDFLRPHESQHARPPCPSPTPRVHSDSRPSSQWCHPAISSPIIPSPPAPNPSQHQSLFQWVNSSHEVAKVLEFQL